MKLNERIASITPSVSLSITSKAKALAAAGENIFSFAAGEPDFDTPQNIKAAAAKALSEGQKVEYEEGRGPKGPRAENVRLV